MKGNRVFSLVGICLSALVLVITGCTPKAGSTGNTVVPTTSGFPLQLTDQAGDSVTITKIPQRIISLAPSSTEIIYALGLGDKLVAGTEYDDYPEEAKSKPRIGGYTSVDIEKVVSFQPDLVVAADAQVSTAIPELKRLGITVITLYPESLEGVMASIELLGRATGTEDKASELVSDMRARTKAVTDKTDSLTASQRPSVLYVLWHDPMMTVGPHTFVSELITKGGGSNIADGLESDYPTMSLEAVISANPAVIVADGGHGDATSLPFDFARTEPRLAAVTARQNSRIYQINSDIVTIPGPRIVDGLEEMARLIHPEIFGQSSR